MMRFQFKDEHTFEDRKGEAERIRTKYPDRIPVICEKVDNTDVPTVDKKKYLVPSDLTMEKFLGVIRKRIHLPPEKAFFLYLDNGALPSPRLTVALIYEQHCDQDGFLYLKYSGENTFGKE